MLSNPHFSQRAHQRLGCPGVPTNKVLCGVLWGCPGPTCSRSALPQLNTPAGAGRYFSYHHCTGWAKGEADVPRGGRRLTHTLLKPLGPQLGVPTNSECPHGCRQPDAGPLAARCAHPPAPRAITDPRGSHPQPGTGRSGQGICHLPCSEQSPCEFASLL